MTARKRDGRWLAVLVASLTAHILGLLALGTLPEATRETQLNSIDISFTVAAPQEVKPETPEPAAKPEPMAAAPRRDSPPEPQLPRTTRQAPPPSTPTVEVEPEEAEPSAKPAMVQLDPSSVARAFVLSQPPSADEGEETQAAEGRTKDTRGKSFERAGDPSYLSTRDPPKLQRNKDGTYRYKGHAFKALVTEDGSVEFDDGYKQGSTVVFDMTDMMLRRRGEDPYRVEKRWFMEGTEELRADLLRRWQAKQLRAALVSLRGALIRIYENDQLTESQKASRVIAMFQDTANDEAGEAARSAIATFVSENMPEVDLPRSVQ